jgi:hypothetical protein
MQCPQCQHENRAGRRFCAACGALLDVSCAACGFMNEPGEKFCGRCGIPRTGHPLVRSPDQPTQRQPDAESRFHAMRPAVMGLLQRIGSPSGIFPRRCLRPAPAGRRGSLAAPATLPARRGAAARGLDTPRRMGDGRASGGYRQRGPRSGPLGQAGGDGMLQRQRGQ